MKIAIIGSTGFVGKILLSKATGRGHKVKALVRNPEKLGDFKNKVEAVKGDMFVSADLKKLVEGADAVISVAGPPMAGKFDYRQYENAMLSLTEAMKSAGIKRIITIAGASIKLPGESLGFKRKFLRVMLKILASKVVKLKDSEAKILFESGLKWTIVRPPLISNGNAGSNIIALENGLAGMKVNVEDIVDFILNNLLSEEWVCKAPTVSSK